MRRFALFLAPILLVLACSRPAPPVGHWQGAYESTDLMIVARLEIAPDGVVRVSAPNASADFAGMDAEERDAIREKLQTGLALSWSHVPPSNLEFDGEAFHKPGGVAPQLEWDDDTKRMTLVFYSGNHPSVRVPLQAVEEFS